MNEIATVSIDQNRFAALSDMRDRATAALAQWNTAKANAKDKHSAYENARMTFENEFDRLVRATRGEDLPLFDNMSDKIDAAKSDPVVSKLVDRLLEVGHDVNALIVFGYTEQERNEAAIYLDTLDRNEALLADGLELESVTVPAFLIPQPLTPIEVADLINRLDEAGFNSPPARIEALTKAELAEVKAYLSDCERLKAEKGDELTADDLPAAPDCLYRPLEGAGDTPGQGDGQADEAAEEDADEGTDDADEQLEDEKQPANLPEPPKTRGARRKKPARKGRR